MRRRLKPQALLDPTRMKWARVSRKLLRALLHLLLGLWTIWFRFEKLPVAERGQQVHQWARRMLSIIEVELHLQGEVLARGPVLLVSNHISWLDILVLHACGYCRFVSKADVARWPFFRTLARGSGSIFIERESRRDAHRVVQRMAEHLRAGDVLAVFPEGTTGDGATLKPFHANLLQAAIIAPAPVQTIALRFVDRRGSYCRAPRYVDDDWLLASVWRTLTTDGICAEVALGSPQRDQGRNRRIWAKDLQQEIEAMRAAMARQSPGLDSAPMQAIGLPGSEPN